MKKTSISRKSNLELLRIIAMVMIVFSHFSDHGHFIFDSTEITVNRLYLQFISMGGVIGDDLFVLISGYFLIDKDHIKISKVIKMWLQLATYSILIYLIAIFVGYKEFNVLELIKNIFPITFEMWWFPSTYVIMYLVSPLLNRALNNMNKQLLKIYIILFFVLWSIVPFFTHQYLQSSNLSWFAYLYSCGAYIKKYGINIKNNHKTLFILILLNYSIVVAFDVLGTKYPIFSEHAKYAYDKQYALIFLISITMFDIFVKYDCRYSKIINGVAGTCFGIYIISDNYIINPLLWTKIFCQAKYQNSNFLILYSIISVLIVFVVCGIIEYGRKRIEKKYSNKLSLLDEKIKWNLSNGKI